MCELLPLAGFRLRQRNRADCAKCAGGSVRTVSYSAELAHCFRCHWSANSILLARELNLLSPKVRARLRAEARRRRRSARAAGKLAAQERLLVGRLSQELCQLWRIRRSAGRRLGQLHTGAPETFLGEQELAWNALRFVAERALRSSCAYTLASFGKQEIRAQFLLSPAERQRMVQAALLRGFVVADGDGLVEVLA